MRPRLYDWTEIICIAVRISLASGFLLPEEGPYAFTHLAG